MDNFKSPVADEDGGINVRRYLALFWRWSWVILLVALAAGAVTYFVSQSQTPYYESVSLVLVNEASGNQTASLSSMQASERVAATYSNMMMTEPVLRELSELLGLTMTLKEMKESITVIPVPRTQLIQITVETPDPDLSASIANSLVLVFRNQIRDIQSSRIAQSRVGIEAQLAEVETKINSYIKQSEAAVTPAEKARLDFLVAQYRNIYASLLTSYEQNRIFQAQEISSITQIETAVPKYIPVKPEPVKSSFLAVVIAILLVSGFLVVREELDDTIKSPEDFAQKTNLPVLGIISRHKPEVGSPITISNPRSPVAEAYRTLRTNVNFTSVDRPLHTLMITSSEPGEGKTTTTCNLGSVFAQNGKKVIVADCDMRSPRVHAYYGLSNLSGMSTIFAQTGSEIQVHTQPTQVEGLSVITSGSLPPNPSELLGSQKMQNILIAMRAEADIVLLDTPPILAVTDAALLASIVDGVLLVVRPGKTTARSLKTTLEQMQRVNAHVLGVVLNNVNLQNNHYSYDDGNNYHPTKAEELENGKDAASD